MLTIIDYGCCNISAVSNMLDRLGQAHRVASEVRHLAGASRFILPGTGSFDTCITNLRQGGLLNPLEAAVVNQKLPVLGICVGAQILGRRSQEGVQPGLSWVDMEVLHFDAAMGIKVPNMGWRYVSISSEQHPMLRGLNDSSRFYFVHSFRMAPREKSHCILESDYGGRFAAAVGVDNIFGVQFHPEKSHRFGMQLLQNFCDWKF